MIPTKISMLEALRLKDVRNGWGDEVQSMVLKNLINRDLIMLGPDGYELTDLGKASLDAFISRKPSGEGT